MQTDVPQLLLATLWTKILRTTRLVLWCCIWHPAPGRWVGTVACHFQRAWCPVGDCPTWLSNVTVQRDCPTWCSGISSFHVSGCHILQNTWFEMLFNLRWLPVFTSLSFFLLFFKIYFYLLLLLGAASWCNCAFAGSLLEFVCISLGPAPNNKKHNTREYKWATTVQLNRGE